MNIIIPLGGKESRFSNNGYTLPKPLIPIFEKPLFEYVMDHLVLQENDFVFIIYHKKLDAHDFSASIQKKYPRVQFICIDHDTSGASETLYIGITHILKHMKYHNKCLVLDCDTFYTENIVDIFRHSLHNTVFFTKNKDPDPIYSYIEMINDNVIVNISEKNKISDNANTGAYAFTDICLLHQYCKYVLDQKIAYNGEPYTSCVIDIMIKSNIPFQGYKLDEDTVFSLGTPEAVKKYVENTHAFMFDFDGTIVNSDDVYYNVWSEILTKYSVKLTPELFNKYIRGNDDKFVKNYFLANANISLKQLSNLKDLLFLKNIKYVQPINGIQDTLRQIYRKGHKICVVTNCNREAATTILNHMNITPYIDFTVCSEDCLCGKPDSMPYKIALQRYNICNTKCIIFEDTKTGILSGKGIYPKLVVGIDTNYLSDELVRYGANMTLCDYEFFCIDDYIKNMDNRNNDIMVLKNMITKSSTKNIQNISIDETKLKGGFIANVIAFKIETAYGEQLSQILKYENTQENNLSAIATQLKLYEREYYFYTDISKYINVKYPYFYNLVTNAAGNTCGVVLDNLFDKKFEINVNLNENIDVTLKIVDRMAKMHSYFWGKDLKNIFPELKHSMDNVFHPFFTVFIEEQYEAFKIKWFQNLNIKQQKICDDIYKRFFNIQKGFSHGNHLTFIHGDIKSPNIFYDIANGYEPYFIDWQHCAIGKGAQDMVFFVIESFHISNLSTVFQLVKHYYYMKIIEYGVSDYSFSVFERDIIDAICYVPFFTGVWFGTTPHDELIDKSFPHYFISKMFHLLELVYPNI
jgi:HAD superfamily hydrolase (TIGR01509 family)